MIQQWKILQDYFLVMIIQHFCTCSGKFAPNFTGAWRCSSCIQKGNKVGDKSNDSTF